MQIEVVQAIGKGNRDEEIIDALDEDNSQKIANKRSPQTMK